MTLVVTDANNVQRTINDIVLGSGTHQPVSTPCDALGNPISSSNPLNVVLPGTSAVSISGTPAVTLSGSPAVTLSGVAAATPLPVMLVPNATSPLGTKFKVISLATTNAANIKASAGKIMLLSAFNLNASPRFLKLFDLSTTPVPGTSVPVHTFIIPGNTAGAGLIMPADFGIPFTAGIGMSITAQLADNDTTAILAGEVVVNIVYI